MVDLEKGLSKFIDFIFSKDNRKYLILIIVLGAILRFIAANNIQPSVADEMVHGSHAIGIIGSGVINEQNECPVWFYLTDLSYKIFGVHGFSARFLSFFFGILTLPLVYIIAKKLFNEKIALISVFLLAISSYYVRYTLAEMDQAMIFFVLLSFYYFSKGLEAEKISYLSIVFMAVAVLIKTIAITFIPSFVIYAIYILYQTKDINERKKIIKTNVKRIVVSFFIFLLFMSPILVYNYLLYKEKGISDVIFSRFFGISPETYQSLLGYQDRFSLKNMIEIGPRFLKNAYLRVDPLITIFGLIGIFFIFLSNNKNSKIFILLHLITFIFLIGTSYLETHFVIFMIPLCISAGFFIDKVSEKPPIKKLKSKHIILILLCIILLVDMYILWPFLPRTAVFKARDFAIENIGKDDIVLSDGRIYRGRTVFMFHDKHYLEASYFSQVLQQLQSMPGQPIPIRVYFLECIPDDCGWGTIKDQPDFNKSMEDLIDFFKNNSELMPPIIEGGQPYFNIYKATFTINPQIYSLVDSTHQWFYYPVMWKGERYDSYKLDTAYKKLLHQFAYYILWIAIAIAIVSPLFIIYELIKSNKTPPAQT